jgi:16S rRNA (cytosine1402-N4)-methyltransferase
MTVHYHKPVLLQSSLEGLNIKPDGVYVDVTFGGGGHSSALLEQLNENGRLLAFDQDPDALENSIPDSRFQFVAANFSHLSQYLKFYKVPRVDGILADFGVSSHQFDTRARGFSIRSEGRLDMRMNQQQELDAHRVINDYSESELKRIFFDYGELRNAKNLASAICQMRDEKPITTTQNLKEAVQSHVPQRIENKIYAQLFQALRIEVNRELEVLKSFLEQAQDALIPGGRLVCISYHSLEDRLVKRFFQSGNFEGTLKKDFFGNPIRTLKPVGKLLIPSEEEIKENSRSRSAKMRIAEKL